MDAATSLKPAQCIYCGTPVDTTSGEGDHVIPAAFGRFKGELKFRRICPQCNSRIGKCEEQLIRCSPESVLSRQVRPQGSRKRRGKTRVGAHGKPPPQFKIQHEDHEELAVESDEVGGSVESPEQLVIVDAEGKQHVIRLFPTMTAESLRAKVAKLGVKLSGRAHIHADEAATAAYLELIKTVWPKSGVDFKEVLQPGTHRVRVQVQCEVNADYWRAIAKIGFHYFLVSSRRGFTGSEPEFEAIRRFIIEGGDRDQFFGSTATEFRTPFRKTGDGAFVAGQWTHLLAADDEKRDKVAMVCLFMGPQFLAPTRHIRLGSVNSLLAVPNPANACEYVYDNNSRVNGYDGFVRTVRLTRLR